VIGYFSSPWYWLSEATYWEAVRQSSAEQRAIAWVIANRKHSPRPEWSNTFRGVILDGAERGNNRDFTYRHKAKASWMPEWAPIVPIIHAMNRGLLREWIGINFRTGWFLLGYYTGLASDSSGGAVFYKVAGHSEGWFDRQITSGRFCSTGQVDAHEFYTFCPPDVPVTLTGSPEAVKRAYDYAATSGFRFAETGRDIRQAAWWPLFGEKRLTRLRDNRYLTLHDVSYPYLVRDAALYVRRLSEQHFARCGQPLVVTSASRPQAEQPWNASTHSVHPAGIAVDFRLTRDACQAWLEDALLYGERHGFVDVTKEQRPPHFHVVIFPREYRQWLATRQ
jgi:hypothetical protein